MFGIYWDEYGGARPSVSLIYKYVLLWCGWRNPRIRSAAARYDRFAEAFLLSEAGSSVFALKSGRCTRRCV